MPISLLYIRDWENKFSLCKKMKNAANYGLVNFLLSNVLLKFGKFLSASHFLLLFRERSSADAKKNLSVKSLHMR